MNSINKNHWENVYNNKQPNEVSWTEAKPETSLNFIDSFKLPITASIIDIGGGDSNFVDFLIQIGYENITILDISQQAIERAKIRLGKIAKKIKWIVTDITEFVPDQTYDVWHDRATFHFLTSEEQVNKYIDIAKSSVKGYLVVGTFSDTGPEKCSGLPVSQYSQEALTLKFSSKFTKINCLNAVHVTPFNTKQNFTFCSFKIHDY